MGGPIRRQNFNKLTGWAHAVEALGVPGLHFHDLRHTGNQFAANSGAGLRDLMARMGHDSTRAAMIYQNSRKLHQTGEKPQVAMSGRYSSGLSRVLGMAA
jgi:integrase